MRVFGSLTNRIQEGATPTPKVGDGATILMYSDRHAATVIEVLGSRRVVIVIQEDKATRTDERGESEAQEYEYAPDPNGRKHRVTLRKAGRWIIEGESAKNGTAVAFGFRDEYRDFSF